MKTAARVVLGLGAFLLLDGLVYLYTSREWTGSTEILATALVFGYVWWFLRRAVRRAEAAERREALGPEREEVAAGVGPTFWPFGFSLAAVVLVLGVAVERWLLVPGAILFVASSAGWFIDIKRQHAAAP